MARGPLGRLAVESLEERTVLSTVTGSAFNDADGNGVRGAGEAGIAGAVVYLDLTGDNVADAGEPAAVTAADGSYSFADAPSGTYAVRQVGTPAFTQTTANPSAIVVTDGAAFAGGDFGDKLAAGVSMFAAAGAEPAAIQAAVDAFRAALGTLNPNQPGVQNGGAGRREINWDGVPDSLADPNALPPDFFNTNSPRGVVYGFAPGSAGTGFAVSANSANPTNSPIEFGTFDPTYTGQFQTFSPQRLFSPVGDNAYEVNFFVAGSSTPATVSGFGAVFTGVDNTTASSIEYFDAAGKSLGKFTVPPATNGLSFLGVEFTDGRRVAKVRVTGGNTVIGGLDNGPVDDAAVQDDFIFGEPSDQVPPTVPPAV
ncbi:MAG TPA: SdrD B-like domain-containing protein, partial [Gemmataceae bacterium]|nr:SdrD B-like domain-containing protein [Gemmataceae bacterium]